MDDSLMGPIQVTLLRFGGIMIAVLLVIVGAVIAFVYGVRLVARNKGSSRKRGLGIAIIVLLALVLGPQLLEKLWVLVEFMAMTDL